MATYEQLKQAARQAYEAGAQDDARRLLERAAELSEILAKKCAKPARSRRRRSEDQ